MLSPSVVLAIGVGRIHWATTLLSGRAASWFNHPLFRAWPVKRALLSQRKAATRVAP
jgi:hypothetical protein